MGRSPGGGNGNLVQNSCLEGSMDRGAWWAAVHRITESDMERVWSAREFTHTFTTASQMGQDGICYQEGDCCYHQYPKMQKQIWNWVMSRSGECFEGHARQGLYYCEWTVRGNSGESPGRKKESCGENFRLREHLSDPEWSAGGNMDDKGHSDEVSDRNEENVIGNQKAVILV